MDIYVKKLFLTVGLLFQISLNISIAQNKQIFISINGNDSNPGTLERPLKTLDKAINISKNANTTIFLRKGDYRITTTLKIENSNVSLKIINYKNEKVSLTGGLTLDKSKIKKVSEIKGQTFSSRIIANNIFTTNLKEHHISTWKTVKKTGFDASKVPTTLGVYENDNPLTLARWPNDSIFPIGKVIKNGSSLSKNDSVKYSMFKYENKTKKWQKSESIWVGGIFSVGWAYDNLPIKNIDTLNKIITLNGNPSYGIYSNEDESSSSVKSAKKIRGFYYYNILEELDNPGEYYIDDNTGDFFYWPKDTFSNSTIEISVLDVPFFEIENTSNIQLENLIFRSTKHSFIKANKCNNLKIINCSFKNNKLEALTINNSTDILISNSTFKNSGAGEIIINGGNRKTLKSSNIIISNCEFSNFSLDYQTYNPALKIDGVGIYIDNCHIHDSPGQGVLFSGNDHLIKNSIFENLCTRYSDIGAIYTGRDPSSTGTTIENNLFYKIRNEKSNMVSAIYIDDGSGGISVNCNIFVECGSLEANGFGAININGGGDNILRDNQFVNCGIAYSSSAWSDQEWKKRFFYTKDNLNKLINTVDIRSSIFVDKYPYLKSFFDSTTVHKRINYSINSKYFGKGKIKTGVNFESTNEVISKNIPNTVILLKQLKTLNKIQKECKFKNIKLDK